MNEAEEVFNVVFPSGDEPTEVMQPREKSLHLPAMAVAAQLAPILCFYLALAAMRSDQLDSVFFCQLLVERVRVVGFVADEPLREFIEEASAEDAFDELAFVRRSTFHRYGKWKTVIRGDSDDLRALAPTRGTDGEAPFLALAKVASMNASSRLSLPAARRCSASLRKTNSSLPERTHC